MNFLELAKNRYTSKKYDPTKKVSEDLIEQLKEILTLCPSSINSQPWNFTIVSDGEVKKQLVQASMFNAQRADDASHLVVFSAIDSIEKFEEQIQNLGEGTIQYYNNYLKAMPANQIKLWMQHQVYISLGYFLSACASLGIDSTPMEGIEANKYADILKLDGYKTLFAVAIGYRDASDENQPSVTPKLRLPQSAVIKSI